MDVLSCDAIDMCLSRGVRELGRLHGEWAVGMCYDRYDIVGVYMGNASFLLCFVNGEIEAFTW